MKHRFEKLPANCFLLKLLSEHGLCIPNKRKELLEVRTNELKKVIRYCSKYEHSSIRKRSEAENSDPDFKCLGEGQSWVCSDPSLAAVSLCCVE